MIFHSEIDKYLESNKVPTILLRYLNIMPEEIKNSIDKILKISKPNISTLKQLLELACDINSKTSRNPLDDKELIKLIKNSGIKEAVKKLRRIRMPKISQRISDINSLIKKIELKIIKVNFDQSFESQSININAELSSMNDVELLEQDLEKLKVSNVLDKIIEKYKR